VKHLAHIRRRLKRIDNAGAAAVEFAIVGSTFVLMVLAAFEFGYMLFVQSILDNAARDAARLIRTGQVQVTADPNSTFQTLLCADVGSLIGCGNLIYQAQIFSDWNSAQTTMNTPPTRDKNGNLVSAGFNAGVAGQIMVVTVTYNYPFFTPLIGSMMSSTNSAFLMATVVFQNEPY
jgi:Flp pilus assembly protein TadG